MRRALELARQGLGRTSPNPPVGAVLVRDGAAIGAGFHRGAGFPHAEIEAFEAARKAGIPAAGATLYVTLEPCSTRGRTGACTEAIKREGVARVVYGVRDPNPAHHGAADVLLRDAGIEVMAEVLKVECEQLILPFSKVQSTGLPWVIAKTAMGLDGRIARPPGEGRWLSGEASRADVQSLRGEVDAILTSGKTVREDNPRLTLRDPVRLDGKVQPWRCILTSREDGVPGNCLLLTDEHRDRTLVFQGRRIESVFRELVADYGICTVLVEAGGRLLGRLLDEGWIDEMVVYLCPMLTGGEVCAVGGEGVAHLSDRLALSEVTWKRFGDDVRLRGRVGLPAKGLER